MKVSKSGTKVKTDATGNGEITPEMAFEICKKAMLDEMKRIKESGMDKPMSTAIGCTRNWEQITETFSHCVDRMNEEATKRSENVGILVEEATSLPELTMFCVMYGSMEEKHNQESKVPSVEALLSKLMQGKRSGGGIILP